MRVWYDMDGDVRGRIVLFHRHWRQIIWSLEEAASEVMCLSLIVKCDPTRDSEQGHTREQI